MDASTGLQTGKELQLRTERSVLWAQVSARREGLIGPLRV